jgi:hypothetical protein
MPLNFCIAEWRCFSGVQRRWRPAKCGHSYRQVSRPTAKNFARRLRCPENTVKYFVLTLRSNKIHESFIWDLAPYPKARQSLKHISHALITFLLSFCLFVSQYRDQIASITGSLNAVFWDLVPCGYCKNRPSGGTMFCFYKAPHCATTQKTFIIVTAMKNLKSDYGRVFGMEIGRGRRNTRWELAQCHFSHQKSHKVTLWLNPGTKHQ